MIVITATKLSSKGQIVIPKAIRKELGLREGDTLIIASHGDTSS
jgi:AbrB family looped-hinge helix DNA binding protein